jgi:hypothetical protein
MQRLARGIQGFSLVLFIWVSTEAIPFPPDLRALPSFFTLRVLTKIHPILGAIPTWVWILIAFFSLVGALWPARNQPIQRWTTGLIVCGLLGIPLYVLFKGESWGSYLWSFHLLTWMGANLWVRDPDYLYATLLGGACLDLIAASQALAQGLATIPQFYARAVSPTTVIVVDSAFAVAVFVLWMAPIRRRTPKGAENLGGSSRVVWRNESPPSS